MKSLTASLILSVALFASAYACHLWVYHFSELASYATVALCSSVFSYAVGRRWGWRVGLACFCCYCLLLVVLSTLIAAWFGLGF